MTSSANTTPRRVLHVLWSGAIGGQERAVSSLVREQLRDPTLEPALLFAQSKGPYYRRALELGCPVLEANLSSGRALHRIPAVAGLISGFDIHHFHSAETLMMLASLRVRGAARVYTHRAGFSDYSGLRRLRYALTGSILRERFHGFSGNTARAARSAASLFRIDEERFQVTYNGLDLAPLQPRRPATEVRRELGLADDELVIGTAAHLRDWKRIDRLVRATGELEAPNARLVIAGDGPDRPRLEQIAEEIGIAQRVVFAGWREHPGDLLQIMDVFSLPSSSGESFGNAVVEAMAIGVPSIVFADGGGMVEHIDSGHTGYVVEDQAELVKRLDALLADHRARREMGDAARESVAERYTPASSAAAYRRLYDSLRR